MNGVLIVITYNMAGTVVIAPHKNGTKVRVIDQDGNEKIFDSIRQCGEALHLDRHKIARILKGEFVNHYDYQFDYVM